eukprot:2962697-Rhodomonas_salina.1
MVYGVCSSTNSTGRFVGGPAAGSTRHVRTGAPTRVRRRLPNRRFSPPRTPLRHVSASPRPERPSLHPHPPPPRLRCWFFFRRERVICAR